MTFSKMKQSKCYFFSCDFYLDFGLELLHIIFSHIYPHLLLNDLIDNDIKLVFSLRKPPWGGEIGPSFSAVCHNLFQI